MQGFLRAACPLHLLATLFPPFHPWTILSLKSTGHEGHCGPSVSLRALQDLAKNSLLFEAWVVCLCDFASQAKGRIWSELHSNICLNKPLPHDISELKPAGMGKNRGGRGFDV